MQAISVLLIALQIAQTSNTASKRNSHNSGADDRFLSSACAVVSQTTDPDGLRHKADLESCEKSEVSDGIAAFKAGRYSIALEKLKQVHNNLATAFLGLTQAALNNCNDAVPNLTATLGRVDPVTNRLEGLAAIKCYEAAGETTKATSLLQELEQHYPNDADVLYASAKFHMKAFNDATYAMFQRTPASYRVHELSGEIFETQDRFQDAINEYRKAIELNPAAPDLHYRLGRVLLLHSHSPETLDQAAAEFHSELKLSPEDAACEYQLGQIAEVKGGRDEAQSHFERALALSPAFVAPMIALGKIYSQQKRFDQAIAVLVRAAAIQPRNESAHYALMTAYRDAGEIDNAKSEKAILDELQKPKEGGEFSEFLRKLGENPPQR